jgi:predicted GIY-YIG superfamily endonuclease
LFAKSLHRHHRRHLPPSAIRREKQIQAWRRAKRLALIEEMNPAWLDLAEGWGELIKLLTADASLRSS